MNQIHDFHAHIYFDPDQLGIARALGAALRERFDVLIGHFHLAPIGPHPRGSCQVTVATARFGEVATWLSTRRAGLTTFAHASTGDDHSDHRHHVVWFGPSEPLDLSMFGADRP